MYQADPEMIDVLKMLNGAGYHTEFHCSAAHMDDNSDISRMDMEYPTMRRKFTRGPHVIISDMSDEDIESLLAEGKMRADGYTPDTKLQVEIEVSRRSIEKILAYTEKPEVRVDIVVMCADIDLETMKEACRVLTEFVEHWLKSINNGEIPTNKGHKLRRISNTCWFS